MISAHCPFICAIMIMQTVLYSFLCIFLRETRPLQIYYMSVCPSVFGRICSLPLIRHVDNLFVPVGRFRPFMSDVNPPFSPSQRSSIHTKKIYFSFYYYKQLWFNGMIISCFVCAGSFIIPFAFLTVWDLTNSLTASSLAAAFLIFDIGMMTLNRWLCRRCLPYFFPLSVVDITSAEGERPCLCFIRVSAVWASSYYFFKWHGVEL